MQNLSEPFLQQICNMDNALYNSEKICVGTLGPDGTSSEIAVQYLIRTFEKTNPKCRYLIKLYNTFDEVYEAMRNYKIDYALIPAAYEKISEFFWCPEFRPVLSFIYDTPKYGIVRKKNRSYKHKKCIKLATCPAAHMVFDYLMKDIKQECEIHVITTNSTVESAALVMESKADFGVTNESSYKKYGDGEMEFITNTYSSRMIWTLFKQIND